MRSPRTWPGTVSYTHLDVYKRQISAFLGELGEGPRTAFLRRYWYADTVEETAGHLGWSLSRTKSVLFRTRKKLKAYLEQEGML